MVDALQCRNCEKPTAREDEGWWCGACLAARFRGTASCADCIDDSPSVYGVMCSNCAYLFRCDEPPAPPPLPRGFPGDCDAESALVRLGNGAPLQMLERHRKRRRPSVAKQSAAEATQEALEDVIYTTVHTAYAGIDAGALFPGEMLRQLCAEERPWDALHAILWRSCKQISSTKADTSHDVSTSTAVLRMTEGRTAGVYESELPAWKKRNLPPLSVVLRIVRLAAGSDALESPTLQWLPFLERQRVHYNRELKLALPFFAYRSDAEHAVFLYTAYPWHDVGRHLATGLTRMRDGYPKYPYQDEGAAVMHVARVAWEGVRLLHAKGVAHNDLKPSNILLTAVGDLEGAGPALSRTPEICTRAYRPFNVHCTGLQRDAYAFGVTLFELLVGHHLRAAENIVRLLTDSGKPSTLHVVAQLLRAPEADCEAAAATLSELDDELKELFSAKSPVKLSCVNDLSALQTIAPRSQDLFNKFLHWLGTGDASAALTTTEVTAMLREVQDEGWISLDTPDRCAAAVRNLGVALRALQYIARAQLHTTLSAVMEGLGGVVPKRPVDERYTAAVGLFATLHQQLVDLVASHLKACGRDDCDDCDDCNDCNPPAAMDTPARIIVRHTLRFVGIVQGEDASSSSAGPALLRGSPLQTQPGANMCWAYALAAAFHLPYVGPFVDAMRTWYYSETRKIELTFRMLPHHLSSGALHIFELLTSKDPAIETLRGSFEMALKRALVHYSRGAIPRADKLEFRELRYTCGCSEHLDSPSAACANAACALAAQEGTRGTLAVLASVPSPSNAFLDNGAEVFTTRNIAAGDSSLGHCVAALRYGRDSTSDTADCIQLRDCVLHDRRTQRPDFEEANAVLRDVYLSVDNARLAAAAVSKKLVRLVQIIVQ